MTNADVQRRFRASYATVTILLALLSGHWIFVNLRDLGLTQYLRDVNGDDSFYYLQIAKNLARHQFSTFDGISRTNGHHPLWTVLLTGFHAASSDREQVLRITKSAEFTLLAFSAFAILAAAYRARSFPLLWCWPLVLFFGEPSLYLGLEAALQLFLLSGVLLALAFRGEQASWSRPVLLLTLALIPWVRLETATFALCVAALDLAEGSRDRLRGAAVPLLAVTASTLGYLSYNWCLFDSALPVSGELKNLYSELLWQTEGGRPGLFGRLQAQLAIDQVRAGMIWGAVGCTAVALGYHRRKTSCQADRALDRLILGLTAAHLARLGYSVLSVHPRYAQYGWYFVPGLMLKAVAVPLFAHRLLQLMKARIPAKLGEALQWVFAAAVALILAPANPYRLRESWLASREVDWERASHAGVAWLDGELPAGSVIGSEDAGVIAYFSRHRVINLDGLVNSSTFARALESGRHREALNALNVTHIANVMSREAGCYTFAKMRDQRPLLGRLTLLHEGPTTSDGKLVFRVCRYQSE